MRRLQTSPPGETLTFLWWAHSRFNIANISRGKLFFSWNFTNFMRVKSNVKILVNRSPPGLLVTKGPLMLVNTCLRWVVAFVSVFLLLGRLFLLARRTYQVPVEFILRFHDRSSFHFFWSFAFACPIFACQVTAETVSTASTLSLPRCKSIPSQRPLTSVIWQLQFYRWVDEERCQQQLL